MGFLFNNDSIYCIIKFIRTKFLVNLRSMYLEYFFALIVILILLVLIVSVCVVFTNAVEHLGKYYDLGHGAVGSVLAAVGTALPETIVPLVAIFGAYIAGSTVGIGVGEEIGLGAILGAPFLLSTLAMFVTGIAVLIFVKSNLRSPDINIDVPFLLRDLKFFLVSYTVAVLSTFIKIALFKYVVGFLLLAFYLFYVFRTIKKCCNGCCEEEVIEELYLIKLFRFAAKFKIFFVWVQIILSILGLIFFSHLFVEKIKFVASSFNIAPLIISLLLAPVATELPEMFNSVIWVNRSKDTLALSNITGAMVFQSCIPMAIGLFFTPWSFSLEAMVNILLVYFAVILLYFNILKNKKFICPKTLIFSGMFYFVYLGYILFSVFVK